MHAGATEQPGLAVQSGGQILSTKQDGVNSRCCCVQLDQIMTTHATETLLIVKVGIAWCMGICCQHHSHQLGLGTV